MEAVPALVRIAAGDGNVHLMEFAAPTLQEAVGQALAWNADRSNHGRIPSQDVVLHEWRFDENTWVEVDVLSLLNADE